MKRLEITHWDPEFCPEDSESLYDYLENEGELPDDDEPWIGTKKEFLDYDAYEENHWDMDDDDEVKTAGHFASMLEKVRDLKDDDVLQIPLNYDSCH